MKRALAFLPFLALSFGLCAAGVAPEIRDDSDRIGYSIGYQIGGDFRRQGVELRPDLVLKGIRDAVDGANPLMTPEEMNRTLVELKRKVTPPSRNRRGGRRRRTARPGRRSSRRTRRRRGSSPCRAGCSTRS